MASKDDARRQPHLILSEVEGRMIDMQRRKFPRREAARDNFVLGGLQIIHGWPSLLRALSRQRKRRLPP
jgi:hypothetical protein